MQNIPLQLAEIIKVLAHTPPNACPHCQGLGVVIREDKGRLFEWPCIRECPPPFVSINANKRRR